MTAEPVATFSAYPKQAHLVANVNLTAGSYRARFALDSHELDAILRLRFQVFNVELDEGLDDSWSTHRDHDRFDAHCHHLLVEDSRTGTVIGTYRMQTRHMAEAGEGFYSADEYDLAKLPPEILASSVEVGRACIAKEHRNRQVLFLLWRGLATYMQRTGMRYLFGCSSINSQNPAEGLRLERQLRERGKVRDDFLLEALPRLRCLAENQQVEATPDVDIPTLFGTYLRYGAKVCSEPAIDRDFKTIDFLVLLDIEELSDRSRRLFFE